MIFPSRAASQEPKGKEVTPFAGTQAFCRILHDWQLQPVQKMADLTGLAPAETLIVIFGDLAVLDDIAPRIHGLENFKRQGGAILIASDRDDGRGRLSEWLLSINGEVVTEDKATAYKHIPVCPWIGPGIVRKHPVFQGIGRGLATYLPSHVRAQRRSLPILASFSEGCRTDAVARLGQASYVVGSVGGDRALLIAGHGVFLNGMMAQFDNDNLAFARNCVQWLSENRHGGKRKYALFVDEGQIKDRFDVSLTLPMSAPFPTVQMLNKLLVDLERRNFFNRLLQHYFTRQQIVRTLLLLATGVLIWVGWRRLGRSRFHLDSRAPRVALEPVAAFEHKTLMEGRHQALVKAGNYWEPGRALARFFFEKCAGLAPLALKKGEAQAACPAIAVPGGWWRKRSVSRQVRSLWDLAYGRAGFLSGRQLARLPRNLDWLTEEIRNRRLILVTAS